MPLWAKAKVLTVAFKGRLWHRPLCTFLIPHHPACARMCVHTQIFNGGLSQVPLLLEVGSAATPERAVSVVVVTLFLWTTLPKEAHPLR